MNNIDPISAPEHILLSRIISDAWQAGKDVDMGELIMQTQNPPFEKIGFFDVEQFFPRKDRFGLAMKLNNVLASPSFQPWMTGEPLDIQNLLYAPDGRPRHSIFYIAHLEETERMFLVTLLYSAIETWMRGQSGTTNLRALVYFDEIFGYLPPSANPPSKTPMLRMLKQARAFGVGLVLATQNPVDIDYKALSNAGTWFIGRLQTERDKMRLLDGLQSSGSDFDRRTADAMLSSLGKRVFLVNNVHNRGGPQLFQTRWAMNYLAGPMTRNQIQDLNELAGADDGLESMPTTAPHSTVANNAVEAIPATQQQRTAPTSRPAQAAPSPLDDYTKTRAAIPADLEEYYLPRRYSLSRALDQIGWQAEEAKALGLIYLPGLWMQVDAYYTNRSGSFGDDKSYAIYVDNEGLQSRIRFDEYAVPPVRFGELPSLLNNGRQAKAQSKLYIDHIYRTASIELYENKKLKLVSQPNESLEKFRDLCEDEADKYEDAEIEKIQRRFRDKMDRTQDRLRKEERELDEDEARLSSLKMETMVNYGETLVNIASRFFGGSRRRSLGVSSSLRKKPMWKNPLRRSPN